MDEYIIVLITASGEDEGSRIGRELVQGRLAACVNMIRNIRSIYRWKDNIEDESEVLLIAKTRKDLFKPLSEKVKELHSYSVPEIIAVPVIRGSEKYLNWIADETAK